MPLPLISDVASTILGNSIILELVGMTVPAPQEGRVFVISVQAVSSLLPAEVVTNITIPGASLGNGITQIGVDQIIKGLPNDQHWALSGLFYVQNDRIPSSPFDVTLQAQNPLQQFYACVYSLTRVNGEIPTIWVQGTDDAELDPNTQVSDSLTTVADNSLVIDAWSMHSEAFANAFISQQLVDRQQHALGASVVTMTPVGTPQLVTFVQSINQESLARAWHAAVWAGFGDEPRNVSAGGPYSVEVNSAVQLTGSLDLGTDQNPAFAWRVVSGGGGSFSNFTLQSPTFTPSMTGAYVLEFSVDPNDGPPVTAQASLDSTATPPTNVDAGGPYTGTINVAEQLNGSFTPGSVADPTIFWNLFSGGAGVFSDTGILNPTFTPGVTGPYTLRLSVDDGVNVAIISDAAFESINIVPPTMVDSGGPYDGTINLPTPIQGSFVAGTDPNPGIKWSQLDGTIGVFADDIALGTTFTLSVKETVQIRLTITPAEGPAVSHSALVSTQECAPPAISLTTINYFDTGNFMQFEDPPIPVYENGDWSILRARLIVRSAAPLNNIVASRTIGGLGRLIFSGGLTIYQVYNEAGDRIVNILLDEPLPFDVMFLLGVRIEQIDVITGEVVHKIFLNNVQIGEITVMDPTAGNNDPQRMMEGSAGLSIMSLQWHQLRPVKDDIIITAPLDEGQGRFMTAYSTSCLEYGFTLYHTSKVPVEGVDFEWSNGTGVGSVSPQHNDAELSALHAIVAEHMINDGLLAFYQFHGATANAAIDAERQFLLTLPGIVEAHTQDMWLQFLRNIPSVPLYGSISEMKAQWWALGAPLR